MRAVVDGHVLKLRLEEPVVRLLPPTLEATMPPHPICSLVGGDYGRRSWLGVNYGKTLGHSDCGRRRRSAF